MSARLTFDQEIRLFHRRYACLAWFTQDVAPRDAVHAGSAPAPRDLHLRAGLGPHLGGPGCWVHSLLGQPGMDVIHLWWPWARSLFRRQFTRSGTLCPLGGLRNPLWAPHSVALCSLWPARKPASLRPSQKPVLASLPACWVFSADLRACPPIHWRRSFILVGPFWIAQNRGPAPWRHLGVVGSRSGGTHALPASAPWWHASTSALPWHGSILGLVPLLLLFAAN